MLALFCKFCSHFYAKFLTLLFPFCFPPAVLQFYSSRCSYIYRLILLFFPSPCLFFSVFSSRMRYQNRALWTRTSHIQWQRRCTRSLALDRKIPNLECLLVYGGTSQSTVGHDDGTMLGVI